jgi:hypothetical protein
MGIWGFLALMVNNVCFCVVGKTTKNAFTYSSFGISMGMPTN